MYLLAGAVAVACIGALWDVFTYRIPNFVTYPAIIVGILAHLIGEGPKGLLWGVSGTLVGGGFFLLLYLLRTMGAGDVKLMAAVGAFAGPLTSIEIMLYAAIAGGILALIVAVYKRRLRRTVNNVVDLVRFHAAVGAEVHPSLNLDNPDALRFAYAVAIFAGTLFVFVKHAR